MSVSHLFLFCSDKSSQYFSWLLGTYSPCSVTLPSLDALQQLDVPCVADARGKGRRSGCGAKGEVRGEGSKMRGGRGTDQDVKEAKNFN